MPVNTFGDPGSSLGLATQPDYKPITKQDLTQAYSQYSGQGLKLGQEKGKSEQQLYARATDIVLRWWKAQKSQKAAAIAQGSGKPPSQNPLISGSAGGSGAGGGGFANGSGAGSSGFGLPDTAFKPGPNTTDVLQPILTPAEKQQQTLARQAGVQKAAKAEPTTTVLTAAQARQILRSMGVPDTWKPSGQALSSEAALKAWVQRAAHNSQLILMRGQAPILDNNATGAILRSMNSGISVTSVPRSARVSVIALRNYVLQVQRSIALLRQQQAQNQHSSTPVYNPTTSSAGAIQRRTGGY